MMVAKQVNDVNKIIDYVCSGMRLFFPFDGSNPKLIDGGWNPKDPCKDIAVTKEDALSALQTGLLGQMTSFDFAEKLGWKHFNLPGDKGDLFSAIQ